jgi:hypothetical protein
VSTAQAVTVWLDTRDGEWFVCSEERFSNWANVGNPWNFWRGDLGSIVT